MNRRLRTTAACLADAMEATRPFKLGYIEGQIRSAMAQLDRGNSNMARVALAKAITVIEE